MFTLFSWRRTQADGRAGFVPGTTENDIRAHWLVVIVLPVALAVLASGLSYATSLCLERAKLANAKELECYKARLLPNAQPCP